MSGFEEKPGLSLGSCGKMKQNQVQQLGLILQLCKKLFILFCLRISCLLGLSFLIPAKCRIFSMNLIAIVWCCVMHPDFTIPAKFDPYPFCCRF